QLGAVLAGARPDLLLSLGVIDGRNVWKADLTALLDRYAPVVAARGEVQIAPSCSLLHTPSDLALETRIEPEVREWLAFAAQKLEELAVLGRGLAAGREAIAEALAANRAAIDSRRRSPLTNDHAVRDRLATVDASWSARGRPFAER